MCLGILMFIFLYIAVILSWGQKLSFPSICQHSRGVTVIYYFWMIRGVNPGFWLSIIPLRLAQFLSLGWHDLGTQLSCLSWASFPLCLHWLSSPFFSDSLSVLLTLALLPFSSILQHFSACHPQMANSYFQSW